MLGVGPRFPQFALTGVVSNDVESAFQPLTHESFTGKWQVVFFWPKDFTFVCPTEIAAFGRLEKEFRARDAQLLGVSIDSEYVHLAWRREKEELKSLPFPMLAHVSAAHAAASIMAMNNVYYRFLHLVEDAEYAKLPARLRMNVIGSPGIARADFELLALAVSAINGCGTCVASH